MCKSIKELDQVVAEYRSMKSMKEELDSNLSALHDEIIGYLDYVGKDSEVGYNYTVKISMSERRTLDRKRLEADLGSLAEYEKVSQSRRLYVQ